MKHSIWVYPTPADAGAGRCLLPSTRLHLGSDSEVQQGWIDPLKHRRLLGLLSLAWSST